MDVGRRRGPSSIKALQALAELDDRLRIDELAKLGRAEKLANDAGEILKTAPKMNPQLTDEQWAQVKNDFVGQQHEALGLVALGRKKYDDAANAFKAANEASGEPAHLVRQAQALKRKEVQGVVGRIKTAIKAYALTASDLGFGARGEKAAAPAAPKKRTAKTAAATGKVAVKFRDEAGNTDSTSVTVVINNSIPTITVAITDDEVQGLIVSLAALTVNEGGVGAGTVFTAEAEVMGSKSVVKMRVDEPQPGGCVAGRHI